MWIVLSQDSGLPIRQASPLADGCERTPRDPPAPGDTPDHEVNRTIRLRAGAAKDR
jgi:hypothetical protein